MCENDDFCTQLNKSRKSGPNFGLQSVMLNSFGKCWWPLFTAPLGTSGASLGRACCKQNWDQLIIRN